MSKKKDEKQEPVSPEYDQETELDYESEIVEETGIENKLKKMRKELKDAKTQSQEYLTGWQKERASFANYKAEEEKKRMERIHNLKMTLISDFFPVLDSFDMAFGNKASWEAVDKNWRMGVEYIYTQFMNTLANYGVETIDAKQGDSFDPNIHDPVQKIDTDVASEDGTVIKVIQKGYQTKDVVLRPAKVQVATFHSENEA